MKDESQIIDWRSTGRRKARRELYNNYVPYACQGYINSSGKLIECGKTTLEPPKDAPKHFEEIWPLENRVLTSQLQADHESKDVTNNDVNFLKWRCPSCHKKQDSQTQVGEATKKESFW